jgi:hypothetical protein
MTQQAVAKWNGIDIQVSAKMSRTPGVQPDQGLIAFRQGASILPDDINGTLAFYYGGSLVTQWPNARMGRIIDVRGQMLDWQYQVKDRRWKWQYPRIWGRYNIRDDEGTLVTETRKNPRELATLLLQALGETGFSVADLPTDSDLAPMVEWDFTPAAKQLQELVAMYGCDVHLLPNNTVAIIREGTGALPPSSDLKRTPTSGISLVDAPDSVAAFAGDTLFESWLELEPIMYEFPDGETVLLNDSDLMPAAGWHTVDLEEFAQVAADETDPVIRQRMRQAAKDGVYRLWRVKKFAGEATKPPGYVNDPEGSPYPDVTDMRLILPLIPSRLLPGDDTTGEKKFAPAELGGYFWKEGDFAGNTNFVKFRKLDPESFQINAARGHVRLNVPAYRFTTEEDAVGGRTEPAKLWLRCGYHLRQSLYGPRFTHKFQKSTGLSNGTDPEWINRSDVNRTVIATYAADYTEPFTPAASVDNESDIEQILEDACDQRILQYAVTQDPTVYSYNKLKDVATSGRCRQVTHECGVSRLGETTASVNFEHDKQQPQALQKRQIQRDKDLADQQAQNFSVRLKVAQANMQTQLAARGFQ